MGNEHIGTPWFYMGVGAALGYECQIFGTVEMTMQDRRTGPVSLNVRHLLIEGERASRYTT